MTKAAGASNSKQLGRQLALLYDGAAVAARLDQDRVGAAKALRSPEGNPEDLFAAFLLVLALAMVLGCEFIYFKDSYGLDLQRMNTIFKFYHQAWPLLACAILVGSRGGVPAPSAEPDCSLACCAWACW